MFLSIAAAQAASNDNLEIGGPWGSPTSTDATAGWWNPAGLAAGRDTRLMVEAAPTFASVTFDRAEPHGGTDTYELSGIVPFAGAATDFGVHGLGVGVALAAPFVRGGAEVNEPGSASYTMRDGHVQAAYLLAGGGWDILDRVAIGATVALVDSTWQARVDQDTLPDLKDALEDKGNPTTYTDDDLEQERYRATLRFGELKAKALAFSVGTLVRPTRDVTIGLAYVRGAHVDNVGDVTVDFDCPPIAEDSLGNTGAQTLGICDTTVAAKGRVSYDLPSRVHGGVAVQATRQVRVEVMGGWVQWSVYRDFEIELTEADAPKEDARALIERQRLWARANEDSWWAGLDAKGRLSERLLVGGRVLYDRHAVPDEALSTNNYDADDVLLSGILAFKPLKHLEFGVSYTHHFLDTRTVEDSAFGMTIEGERNEDRWYYPHANGTYSGQIDRVGFSVRSEF
jgi:long-subunit fatty acid transport protein